MNLCDFVPILLPMLPIAWIIGIRIGLELNKNIRNSTIWECEDCGRKAIYKFNGHATSKLAQDYCAGKVRRIKFKNGW